MNRRSYVIAGSMLVSATFAGAARADEESDKAKVLFEEASRASDAKNYTLCVSKADEAWSHFHHAQIRGLRGSCNAALGKYREGVIDLAAYVTNAGSDVAPQLKEAFAKAKEHVAELVISSDPPGADLSVDGVTAGKAPQTVFVDPGSHEIAATTTDGAGKVKRDFDAGTRIELSVPIERAVLPPKESRPMWPAVVGFTLGGAGLVAGLITMGVSFSASSDASAAADAKCSPTAPTPACKSAFDSESLAGTTGNVAFGSLLGSGIVLAATIPYLAWALGGSAKDTKAVRVVPVVTADVQAAVVTIEF